MKDFNIDVKLEFTTYGIEAKNKAEAIKKIKDTFFDEFAIQLVDDEIIKISEVK